MEPQGVYGDQAYLYDLHSYQQQQPQDDWYDNWHRHLAEDDDDKAKTSGYRMDYSVLSVAVMTLGLIMVVEVFIHRLDHAAAGRPYFTAVLENIYNECKSVSQFECALYVYGGCHSS